jgi:hypothetical protein
VADPAQLLAAISDLDDSYLKVMLLLAVRRAGSEEPRRAALWHALAQLLAEEQEARRRISQMEGPAEREPGEEDLTTAIDAVREELRRDADALEAEVQDTLSGLESPPGG